MRVYLGSRGIKVLEDKTPKGRIPQIPTSNVKDPDGHTKSRSCSYEPDGWSLRRGKRASSACRPRAF